MKDFPPNVDPKIATVSAVLIGFALIGEFSAAEQSAIGNWFITIGQVIFGNSTWQQMIEERIKGDSININGPNFKQKGDPYVRDTPWMESPSKCEIERLKRIIRIMQEEIDKLQ